MKEKETLSAKQKGELLLKILEFLNGILFGGVLPVVMACVSLLSLPLVFRAAADRLPGIWRHRRKRQERGSGISPLSALAVALGGTLGVGNISGMAVALAAGGAGALFWLWVASLLSAALKYSEVSLAIRYRPMGDPPTGGAMYYIEGTLGGRLGRRAARAFALLCLPAALLIGILPQSGAVAEAAQNFGIPPLFTGAVFLLLALPVVLGGAKRISRVVSAALPPLCLLYILASLVILGRNVSALPGVFGSVFSEAFSFRAALSGGMGFGIARAVRVGFARAVFSGEAGCGTSPMAYAAGNGRSPETQGLLAVIEVGIDTLLCTLTALVLLVSSPTVLPTGSMTAVTEAFGAALGGVAPPLLSLAVFVFAFATVLAWAHYASTALRYLGAGRRGIRCFLVLYAACLLPGALLPSAPVYAAADLNLAALALLNAAALTAAAPCFRNGAKGMNFR